MFKLGSTTHIRVKSEIRSYLFALLMLNILTFGSILIFSAWNGNLVLLQIQDLRPPHSGPLLIDFYLMLEPLGSLIQTLLFMTTNLSASLSINLSSYQLFFWTIYWIFAFAVIKITVKSFKRIICTLVFFVSELSLLFTFSGVKFSDLILYFIVPTMCLIIFLTAVSKIREKLEDLSFTRERIPKTIIAFALSTLILFVVMFLFSTPWNGEPLKISYYEILLSIVTYPLWTVILSVPPGIVFWNKIQGKNALNDHLTVIDTLEILILGIIYVGSVAWFLLEIGILNLGILFVFALPFYVHLIKHFFTTGWSHVHDTFNRATHLVSKEILPLQLILILLLLLTFGYYFLQTPYSLPWYDGWSWWGTGYAGARLGHIFFRYSYFYPGAHTLFVTGLLSSVFSILPLKSLSLIFMRILPFITVFIECVFLYALAKELKIRIVKPNDSILRIVLPLMAVVAFLSSSWTLFYASYFVRESIGILLVEAILGLAIIMDRTRVRGLYQLYTMIFLGIVTLYVSPIQFIVFPAVIMSILLCPSTRHILCSHKKKTVGFIFLVLLPFMLSRIVIAWRTMMGWVGEQLPGYMNTDIVHSATNHILNQKLPIYQLNLSFQFSEALPWYGYSIINTVGFFCFVIGAIGLVWLIEKLYRRETNFFFWLLLIYALELILFPFLTAILGNIIQIDNRRFVPQLAIVMGLMFMMGVYKILNTSIKLSVQCKILRPFKVAIKKTRELPVKSVLLLFILLIQLNYALVCSSSIDHKSQTEAAELLMGLDNALPDRTIIVPDHQLLEQAVGLLAPRTVADPGDFAGHFSGISGNRNIYEKFVSYVTTTSVVILVVDTPTSVLREMLISVQRDYSSRLPLVSLGKILILTDGYLDVYAIVSPNISDLFADACVHHILFFDDFNQNISKWIPTTGIWWVEAEADQNNVYGSDSPDCWTFAGNISFADYTLQLKMKGVHHGINAYFSVLFRAQSRYECYTVDINKNGVILLGKWHFDNQTTKYTVMASKQIDFTSDSWYYVVIEVLGNSIKVYLDDQTIFDITDSTFSSGKIGLAGWLSSAYYDDIVVWNWESTKTGS